MAQHNKTTPLLPPHKQAGFKGYTINELRHQRMLTQIRRDFIKEKLINDSHTLREIKLLPQQGSKSSALLSIATQGLRIFSYADLFSIGFSLFRTGSKIFSFFKKR